ncbi:MAG: hypothetical protein L3J18_12145 [Candidatus Brocadia sp.]|nr:MAG: hypothetical protein L3J18_12145 [Candidatus Brocadia sp.]
MKTLKNLLGVAAAVVCMGFATSFAAPDVFAGEAKKAEDWNMTQDELEEEALIDVTNGDVLGERAKDGAWEFHLYTTDGYIEMTNGELVWVFGYTHAKGSFENVGR